MCLPLFSSLVLIIRATITESKEVIPTPTTKPNKNLKMSPLSIFIAPSIIFLFCTNTLKFFVVNYSSKTYKQKTRTLIELINLNAARCKIIKGLQLDANFLSDIIA